MSINLGTRLKWKRVKRKCRAMTVKDTFQYIPLLDSLKVSVGMNQCSRTPSMIFAQLYQTDCGCLLHHDSCSMNMYEEHCADLVT